MNSRKIKNRANLRDVARMAGVSTATVSRVLNASNSVSEPTRKRVQEVIETLQFVPSAAARAINSGRSGFVGALVPTLDNAIFSMFLDALELRLGQHSLSLVVATTSEDATTETIKAGGLVDIGAEALIVSGVTHSNEFYRLIERARVPTVATSYYDETNRLPTVGYDNFASSLLALDHLIQRGHRKIAVVHGPAHQNDRTQSRLAAVDHLKSHAEIQAVETDLSLRGASVAVCDLLARQPKFSAILCLSDVLASGALFELQRHGVRVPDEISLMGIDDLPSSSFTVPQISTVHLPVKRMGTLAAEAVIQWIETQEVPKPILLEPKLIVRESTRDIR